MPPPPIDFPPAALPYCSFSLGNEDHRLGVGFGTDIVDLAAAADAGLITGIDPIALTTGRLNELLAGGRQIWTAVREELIASDLSEFLVPQHQATFHLAWEVGDYVDFYASRHHAENAGRIFRPKDEPLLPNWLHMPVGYHGRSGTIVVDGTPVRRPVGQRLDLDGDLLFGPSAKLDFELEVGMLVGGSTNQGEPIAIEDAADHLFGVVLVNDWSARDIQGWEAQPLGPHLGKSFATSVSAWVMPVDALSDARVPGPTQDPAPLPHLRTGEPWAFDLDLEVWLRPSGEDRTQLISTVNAASGLYWNAAQLLAHLTSNGARVRPGDFFASGTVSGPEPGQRGSLLELSWDGTDPISIGSNQRTYLEDGDEVTLTAVTGDIQLGSVAGVVIPA